MNPNVQIKGLRERGLVVKVRHQRVAPVNATLYRAMSFKRRPLVRDIAVPKHELDVAGTFGGTTDVFIYEDGEDGQLLAHGDALCSPLDPFSKRLGLTIALARALAELEAKGGEST